MSEEIHAGAPNGKTINVPDIQAQQIAAIQEPVRMIVGTMIRGLMVSSPGIDPRILLNAIAWQAGHHLASGIQGDISTLLMLRKAFKAAFDDGVQKAPLLQPPGTPPAPSTRIG